MQFRSDHTEPSVQVRSDHTYPSVQLRKANTDPSMQFRWGHTEFLICKMLGKNLAESVRQLSHSQTSPDKSSCQDVFGKSLCNALPYCHPSELPSALPCPASPRKTPSIPPLLLGLTHHTLIHQSFIDQLFTMWSSVLFYSSISVMGNFSWRLHIVA